MIPGAESSTFFQRFWFAVLERAGSDLRSPRHVFYSGVVLVDGRGFSSAGRYGSQMSSGSRNRGGAHGFGV